MQAYGNHSQPGPEPEDGKMSKPRTIMVTFAEEAGVPDLAAFEECVRLPADSFPRIQAGRELGERRNIGGTPTLFVNGRRFDARSFAELQGVAEELGLESGMNPAE